MALTAAKTIEVIWESTLEFFETQDLLLDMCDSNTPDPGMMQKSNDEYWVPVQQDGRIIEGDDLSGQARGIVEQQCPYTLGTLKNDLVNQKALDLRTEEYWRKTQRASVKKMASHLNSEIANTIAAHGAHYIRANDANGFDFISRGQELQDDLQAVNLKRYFLLNNPTKRAYASDLANKDNLTGRPEEYAWKKGMVGTDVADYDILSGSFLPLITGGANPATTVVGTQSFIPEGTIYNPATRARTPIDYRQAIIPVVDASGYAVGDKVQFANAAVPVEWIGRDTKVTTQKPFTATIVDINGNNVTIFPKPIAFDDPALGVAEKPSSTVNTRILAGATMDRMNIDASAKTNLFWEKDAVTVVKGTIPSELFQSYQAANVLTKTLSNGLTLYCMYKGDIITLDFDFRITARWGVVINDPGNCGVAVKY